MKILLNSHWFSPRVGGIETMSRLLAEAFVARGHEVRVVTTTPAHSKKDDHDLHVLRDPGAGELRRTVQWADVCFHNNISLAVAWPLLLHRRPWVVTTQTWIKHHDGTIGWRNHLKLFCLQRASNVAISRAIAETLPVPAEIIPNCYDDRIFHPATTGAAAKRDLVFVGRLVSDKGADLALTALAQLKGDGLTPTLTIIGDGPERSALEARVRESGMTAQVTFTGSLEGPTLADQLRHHRIQLVPSRWHEPFGIVALEGAACGCVVIGSDQGGLPDAIGPCGMTFPNGDDSALARCVTAALREGSPVGKLGARQAHLLHHQPSIVAGHYLDLFQRVIHSHSLPKP